MPGRKAKLMWNYSYASQSQYVARSARKHASKTHGLLDQTSPYFCQT